MSTIAAKLRVGTQHVQIGAAACAVAAAATLTPAMAHATPDLAPITQGLGNSVELLIEPVVIPGHRSHAKVSQAVPATAAATASQNLLEELIRGIATGVTQVVRGAVAVVGTIAYTAVAFTGGLITAVGEFLPGPLGDMITSMGNGITQVANDIAKTIHVGPYSTSS